MQQNQPAFERLKILFFNSFKNSEEAKYSIQMQRVFNSGCPRFHVRREMFEADFNTWLSRLDIRCAGMLIDVLKANKIDMPAWLSNKSFSIDYNKYDLLDLIKK